MCVWVCCVPAVTFYLENGGHYVWSLRIVPAGKFTFREAEC